MHSHTADTQMRQLAQQTAAMFSPPLVRLRTPSASPDEPRTFRKAAGWALPAAAAVTGGFAIVVAGALAGRAPSAALAVLCAGLLGLALAAVTGCRAWTMRCGITAEHPWWGRGARRTDLPFSSIDRLSFCKKRLRFASGTAVVELRGDLFDCSLAYLGILRELSTRRFALLGCPPDHPEWESAARAVRYEFGTRILREHAAYFDSHPEQKREITSLMP